ncbi:MAG TPA: pyridoxal phosphate-dependent aminotransferase [Candidatus Saccharimonadales bacterium]|nr:pyridoxal phosphate-dependent aminotransferase [Candidatus Saccharimonadales bacterium]
MAFTELVEFTTPPIESNSPAFRVIEGLAIQAERGLGDGETIDFSVGAPLIPPYRRAAQAAIDSFTVPKGYNLPLTSNYTSDADTTPFYSAVTGFFGEEMGLSVSPQNIQPFIGGEHFFTAALQVLFKNPGDVLLMTAPTYGLWALEPHRMNGTTEVINLKAEEDYRLTAAGLEAKIAEVNDTLATEPYVYGQPQIRALLLINPDNPMGTVYDKNEVEGIARVAKRHNIVIIDDQAYRGAEYDTTKSPYMVAQVPGMEDYTLTLLSLSKAYGLPSLRAGIGIGSKALISKFSEHSPFMPPRPILDALAATYTTDPEAQAERRAYLEQMTANMIAKRDLLRSLLGESPHLRVPHMPQSGFFQMVDASEVIGRRYNGEPIQNDRDLVLFLAKAANVHILTNCDYVWPGPEQTMRLSYSLPEEQLVTGMRRIRDAMRSLR